MIPSSGGRSPLLGSAYLSTAAVICVLFALALGMTSCGSGGNQSGAEKAAAAPQISTAKREKKCREVRQMVREESRKAEQRARANGETIDPATLTLKGCEPE